MAQPMKKLQEKPDHVLMLVSEFARKFPSLQTKAGAHNKCKLISMELAAFLRKRGIKAKLIHVQGVRDKKSLPDAHQEWLDRQAKEWSHYVVKSGSRYFDLSARQFDPNADVPSVNTRPQLAERWNLVESDDFLNDWVTEVLPVKEFNLLN